MGRRHRKNGSRKYPQRGSYELGAAARLVAAGVALAMHQNERRTRFLGAVGESVQEGKNTGVGERDSQSYRSRDSKGNDKGNQQTSHVRPTFPAVVFVAISGWQPTDFFPGNLSIAYCAGRRKGLYVRCALLYPR